MFTTLTQRLSVSEKCEKRKTRLFYGNEARLHDLAISRDYKKKKKKPETFLYIIWGAKTLTYAHKREHSKAYTQFGEL